MSDFDSGRSLNGGYCRQRMAEQREENKKIARLAEVVFSRFQFQLSGVPGSHMRFFPIAGPFCFFIFSTRRRRLCG
jgi:hypothetical protein